MHDGLKRFKSTSKSVFLVWNSFFLFSYAVTVIFLTGFSSEILDIRKLVLVFVIQPLSISLFIWVIRELLRFRGYVDGRGKVKVKDLFTFQVRSKPSVGHNKTKGTSDDED